MSSLYPQAWVDRPCRWRRSSCSRLQTVVAIRLIARSVIVEVEAACEYLVMNGTAPGWTKLDLAAMVLSCYAVFVLFIFVFDNYGQRVAQMGDNGSYAHESRIIRGRERSSAGAMHFPGYSLLAAPVAEALNISDVNALPIVSTIGSLVAVGLAGELWGPWAATCFALANLDWIQRSLLGGADPVFAAFVLAALLAARSERWVWASVLGSLATIIRPLGVTALLAIGLVLLYRRNWRALASAVGIAMTVAAGYFLLMKEIFGNALENFAWYRSMGLGHDRTFIPIVTLFLATPGHELTSKNIAKAAVWILLTLCALLAAFMKSSSRRSMRDDPVPWLFGGLYFASFFFLPAWWIDSQYPRYFAPVIPLVFFTLRDWLPRRRWIVWIAGMASVILAAVEDMPVFDRVLHIFHR